MMSLVEIYLTLTREFIPICANTATMVSPNGQRILKHSRSTSTTILWKSWNIQQVLVAQFAHNCCGVRRIPRSRMPKYIIGIWTRELSVAS